MRIVFGRSQCFFFFNNCSSIIGEQVLADLLEYSYKVKRIIVNTVIGFLLSFHLTSSSDLACTSCVFNSAADY